MDVYPGVVAASHIKVSGETAQPYRWVCQSLRAAHGNGAACLWLYCGCPKFPGDQSGFLAGELLAVECVAKPGWCLRPYPAGLFRQYYSWRSLTGNRGYSDTCAFFTVSLLKRIEHHLGK